MASYSSDSSSAQPQQQLGQPEQAAGQLEYSTQQLPWTQLEIGDVFRRSVQSCEEAQASIELSIGERGWQAAMGPFAAVHDAAAHKWRVFDGVQRLYVLQRLSQADATAALQAEGGDGPVQCLVHVYPAQLTMQQRYDIYVGA